MMVMMVVIRYQWIVRKMSVSSLHRHHRKWMGVILVVWVSLILLTGDLLDRVGRCCYLSSDEG